MKFKEFKNYLETAQVYENFDLFMDAADLPVCSTNIPASEMMEKLEIMKEIFTISKMTIREIREKYNISRKKVSEDIGIPNRTLQGWEYRTAKAPEYIELLIKYVYFQDYFQILK